MTVGGITVRYRIRTKIFKTNVRCAIVENKPKDDTHDICAVANGSEHRHNVAKAKELPLPYITLRTKLFEAQ